MHPNLRALPWAVGFWAYSPSFFSYHFPTAWDMDITHFVIMNS